MMKRMLICSTILAMAPAAAFAQASGEKAASTEVEGASQSHVVALEEWAYEDLYSSGWTVETMFDETDVVGENGDEIGDVENVLIDADGSILSLIVEVGGFWDIGDTHVNVPWDEVTLGADLSRITVPVNEENVEDYSVFAAEEVFTGPEEIDTTQVVDDDLYAGERVFKATELIGDYAYLTGSEQYGYVSDLVFNRDDGQLMAVLVDGSATGLAGPYAYPFYGYDYDWHPNLVRYTLPYDAEEITVVDTFEYAEMDSMPAQDGSEKQASGSMDDKDMSKDGSEQASGSMEEDEMSEGTSDQASSMNEEDMSEKSDS